MEQLNAISIQDEEGLVAEPRPEMEKLDEWQTHKLRKHDKPKPRHEELNSSKNQLKVGDNVLLGATDPRIATSKPNEETPLTVISIFPYGMVEVNHSKFGTFKVQCHHHVVRKLLFSSRRSEKEQRHPRVPSQKIDTPSSSFHQEIRRNFFRYFGPDLWVWVTALTRSRLNKAVQFRLGNLVRQLSVPEFGIALGLYTEEFMEDNELNTLHHHIYCSPSKCWDTLVPSSASYNPSHSKALALSPSLRYLYAILAHTLTGWREGSSPLEIPELCLILM
ncbi:hypothetical protein GOBAR_AA09060 [Gossypium barbadense]|uniref:Uncharacterized protein n=1 Tax=Gossypium barbadense TaxID=3634 RepID=A0A2P5Y7L3_GOSBA|nr:hypothetical protein GOBAR_AA09060 [Gossypium barbadense]